MELAKLGPSPCDDEPEPSDSKADDAAAAASGAGGESGDAVSADMMDKIAQLMGVFPDADMAKLKDALTKTNGTLEAAVEWMFSNA